MSTNYPTSKDNLTNPTGSDKLNAPDHAAQHANANDAIEAIEDKLGIGAGTPTATNKILYGTGAGASTWGTPAAASLAAAAHSHTESDISDLDHYTSTDFDSDLATKDLDDIAAGTTNKHFTTLDKSKLDGIEANADVTDATNVEGAGAVMESDTTTASMSFVVDEDDMVSDLDTKVPTQQSVKAYVDGKTVTPGGSDTYVQFNDNGALGGNANLTFDPDTNTTTVLNLDATDINTGTFTAASAVVAGAGVEYIGDSPADSVAVDASAVVGNFTQNLQDADGTIALTSDINATNVAAAGAVMESDFNAKGDLLTATADNTPAVLTAGTDGYVLTTDSAQANGIKWAAPAGGGQTTYDAIVAASGGTHTTLGAAIAAASAGWTILVLDSTTETGNISTSLAGLTIIGASRNTEVNLSTYNLDFNAGNLTLFNLKLKTTTGAIAFYGSHTYVTNCWFLATGYAAGSLDNWTFGGGSSMVKIIGCYFQQQATTGSVSNRVLLFSSAYSILTGCTFDIPARNSSTSTQAILFNSDRGQFTHNQVQIYSSSGGNAVVIRVTGNGCIIDGNDFNSSVLNYVIYAEGTSATICNNKILNGTPSRGIWLTGSSCIITGNYIQTNSASSSCIYVANSYNTIMGNTLIANNGTTDFGINISSGNDNLISNNKIQSGYRALDITTSSILRTRVIGNSFVVASAGVPIVDSGVASHLESNAGVPATLEKTTSYMKNTSGGTLTAGTLVVRKAVAAGDEVTTTTTAGDDNVYGVVTASHSNNAYGHIQTLGKVTTLKADGTTDIAIGDPLTSFTTAGIAAKAAAGDMVIAYALEAYTTDDSNGVLDAILVTPRLI